MDGQGPCSGLPGPRPSRRIPTWKPKPTVSHLLGSIRDSEVNSDANVTTCPTCRAHIFHSDFTTCPIFRAHISHSEILGFRWWLGSLQTGICSFLSLLAKRVCAYRLLARQSFDPQCSTGWPAPSMTATPPFLLHSAAAPVAALQDSTQQQASPMPPTLLQLPRLF